MSIRDFEIGPVEWSENLKFPFCKFCQNNKKCFCKAKDAEKCDFCDVGCQCGYDEVERFGYGQCDCECSCDFDDDDAEECEVCEAGGCICGADEYPDHCYCECECEYVCSCKCECLILVIDHKSFNDWVINTCYVCAPQCFNPTYLEFDHMPTMSDVEKRHCLSQLGPYEFGVRVVPEIIERKKPVPTMREMMGMPDFVPSSERKYITEREYSVIPIYQDGKKARIRFDGPTYVALLSRYNAIQKPGRDLPTVWMSLTPMEVFTQKPGLDMAHGRVLVGGLGMGWLTRRVLEKENVREVIQIELDKNILEFFGEPLVEEFSNLELVHANFWDYIDSQDISQFDTILVDIWPGYQDARRDPKWRDLKNSHSNTWAWGLGANRKRKSRRR